METTPLPVKWWSPTISAHLSIATATTATVASLVSSATCVATHVANVPHRRPLRVLPVLRLSVPTGHARRVGVVVVQVLDSTMVLRDSKHLPVVKLVQLRMVVEDSEHSLSRATPTQIQQRSVQMARMEPLEHRVRLCLPREDFQGTDFLSI